MKRIATYLALCKRLPEHSFALRSEDRNAEAIKWRGLHHPDTLQARIEYMQKELKLKNWLPSSPNHPPKYNMTVHTKHAEIAGMGSRELYAFTWLFNYLTEDKKLKWNNPTRVTVYDHDGEEELWIASDFLEEIAEYKPKGDEKLWHPPEPYASEWERLKTGKAPSKKQQKEVIIPAKQKAPTRPTVERTGTLTTLNEICARLGVDPGKARAKLRKKNEPKPYAWPAEEVARIEKLIK